MKKHLIYLSASAIALFANDCLAVHCGTIAEGGVSCAELGYKNTVAECQDKTSVKCPWNANAVFCGETPKSTPSGTETVSDSNKNCATLGYTRTAEQCKGYLKLKCPFDDTKFYCGVDTCSVGSIVYTDNNCYPNYSLAPNNVKPAGIVIDPYEKIAVDIYEKKNVSFASLGIGASAITDYFIVPFSNASGLSYSYSGVSGITVTADATYEQTPSLWQKFKSLLANINYNGLSPIKNATAAGLCQCDKASGYSEYNYKNINTSFNGPNWTAWAPWTQEYSNSNCPDTNLHQSCPYRQLRAPKTPNFFASDAQFNCTERGSVRCVRGLLFKGVGVAPETSSSIHESYVMGGELKDGINYTKNLIAASGQRIIYTKFISASGLSATLTLNAAKQCASKNTSAVSGTYYLPTLNDLNKLQQTIKDVDYAIVANASSVNTGITALTFGGSGYWSSIQACTTVNVPSRTNAVRFFASNQTEITGNPTQNVYQCSRGFTYIMNKTPNLTGPAGQIGVSDMNKANKSVRCFYYYGD